LTPACKGLYKAARDSLSFPSLHLFAATDLASAHLGHGTYAGIGLSGPEFFARVHVTNLDDAKQPLTTPFQLIYAGISSRSVDGRRRQHRSALEVARRGGIYESKLLRYNAQIDAAEFEYHTISSANSSDSGKMRDRLTIWEALDARFLGGWTGNEGDVRRVLE
ncbi:hypothetical protein V8E36_001771, partial [Tilletia maclaganii]